MENANATADLLASYRTKEQKRRDRFLRKYIGMLPFKVESKCLSFSYSQPVLLSHPELILAVESDTTPHCEISTVHLDSDRPEISRSDVIGKCQL